MKKKSLLTKPKLPPCPLFKSISAVFVIKVKGTNIEISKGQVPNYFIQEITNVSRVGKAMHGKIYGMNRKGYIQLDFSRQVPEGMQQRLRNVWRHTPIKNSKSGLRG